MAGVDVAFINQVRGNGRIEVERDAGNVPDLRACNQAGLGSNGVADMACAYTGRRAGFRRQESDVDRWRQPVGRIGGLKRGLQ